jgi:hypothetical protein
MLFPPAARIPNCGLDVRHEIACRSLIPQILGFEKPALLSHHFDPLSGGGDTLVLRRPPLLLMQVAGKSASGRKLSNAWGSVCGRSMMQAFPAVVSAGAVGAKLSGPAFVPAAYRGIPLISRTSPLRRIAPSFSIFDLKQNTIGKPVSRSNVHQVANSLTGIAYD